MLAQAIAFFFLFFFFAFTKQHLGNVICSGNTAFFFFTGVSNVVIFLTVWQQKIRGASECLTCSEYLRGPNRMFLWKESACFAKKSRHNRHNYNEAWSERRALCSALLCALCVPIPWRVGSVVITGGLANYSTGSPDLQREQPIKTWRWGGLCSHATKKKAQVRCKVFQLAVRYVSTQVFLAVFYLKPGGSPSSELLWTLKNCELHFWFNALQGSRFPSNPLWLQHQPQNHKCITSTWCLPIEHLLFFICFQWGQYHASIEIRGLAWLILKETYTQAL